LSFFGPLSDLIIPRDSPPQARLAVREDEGRA
jgi:hypothetical protein